MIDLKTMAVIFQYAVIFPLLLELIFVIYKVKTTPYPLLMERMYRERWKHIWWFYKGLTGIDSVYDGSTCWFSEKFCNIHDYPLRNGGDGTPSHCHEYTCHKCKVKFEI